MGDAIVPHGDQEWLRVTVSRHSCAGYQAGLEGFLQGEVSALVQRVRKRRCNVLATPGCVTLGRSALLVFYVWEKARYCWLRARMYDCSRAAAGFSSPQRQFEDETSLIRRWLVPTRGCGMGIFVRRHGTKLPREKRPRSGGQLAAGDG